MPFTDRGKTPETGHSITSIPFADKVSLQHNSTIPSLIPSPEPQDLNTTFAVLPAMPTTPPQFYYPTSLNTCDHGPNVQVPLLPFTCPANISLPPLNLFFFSSRVRLSSLSRLRRRSTTTTTTLLLPPNIRMPCIQLDHLAQGIEVRDGDFALLLRLLLLLFRLLLYLFAREIVPSHCKGGGGQTPSTFQTEP